MGTQGPIVDEAFLKTDREMKKVFYELNEEKLWLRITVFHRNYYA